MKFKRLFIVAAVLALASCVSTSKLYNRGNYYQATYEAVRKLRSSPDNRENRDILLKSYPLAVETAKRNINNALQSNDITKYDVVVTQYEQLNTLANEIYTCPKANELIPSPQEYHAELQKAKDLAAEHYYEQGVKALRGHTVEQARNAHNYFLQAHHYVNGYRDVIAKIDEALYAATLHVVVEAPPMPDRYKISSEFFYSNLVTEMNKTNQRRYVVFYTPQDAKKDGLKNPNQTIVLDFLDFTVGNVRETKTTKEVKRDSVPITVELNGRQTTAYTTAKASLTTFRREVVSGGKLRVRIIDADNDRVVEQRNSNSSNDRNSNSSSDRNSNSSSDRNSDRRNPDAAKGHIIDQRTFDGSYTWVSEWGSFTGDDRALSAEQKRLASREATLPPPNQDLFIAFTKPIFTQVVNYIQSVYRKYQ